MTRFLFGFVLCFLCIVAGVLLWFSYGKFPVAVTDPPFPFEEQFVHIPLESRIQHEMLIVTPVKATETNLIAGARIYVDKCAFCHGLHGKPSDIGSDMYPHAPALWEQHRSSTVVGVSDDPPGMTFWKIANGIRLTGMPSYRGVLSDEEMWQVTMLLANADKPLPPIALQLLRVETSGAARAPAAARTPAGAAKEPAAGKPEELAPAKPAAMAPAAQPADPPTTPLVLRVMPPPTPPKAEPDSQPHTEL